MSDRIRPRLRALLTRASAATFLRNRWKRPVPDASKPGPGTMQRPMPDGQTLFVARASQQETTRRIRRKFAGRQGSDADAASTMAPPELHIATSTRRRPPDAISQPRIMHGAPVTVAQDPPPHRGGRILGLAILIVLVLVLAVILLSHH